jgi:hypothetical protein
MLIAVLALGGAILGATTIAGFLMTYEIRQTTDFVSSARAIFAADSGAQWALYDYFVASSTPQPVLGNGATVSVTCYDALGDILDCGNQSSTQAIAKGFSGEAARAFSLEFSGQ